MFPGLKHTATKMQYKNTQMQDIASLKCLQNIYNTVYELNWHIFPNYWQVIFNTNICITKYTNSPTLCTQSAQKPPTWHIPPSIYPIPKYIFKLQYSQMIGSLHLIPTYIFNLQIFPKCWPYRSNTNMFITKCTFPKFAPSNRHASPDCLQIISKTCWIGVSKYCCKF